MLSKKTYFFPETQREGPNLIVTAFVLRVHSQVGDSYILSSCLCQ